MRLAPRIDQIGVAACAALCAAIALIVLPAEVHAQSLQTRSATLADLAGTSPEGDSVAAASSDATPGAAKEFGQLASDAPGAPADAASVNDISLDDQVLARQRGGAVGMLMVAATPQLMRGSSGGHVTLWDEIAPPPPLPIPVDAARAAQGNVATYQRK
ncbi:hypothetical protein FVF58_31000 [Paraburkholderia panacisoli]|uniref:Uncharacterized protein n=1 Tax=Paraburkholderia panacisoli TaxID=2603818 RepID=A0A5B0GMP9_9BURK|nr:hypothetical protein [Paraburkholderia panacisoli]KAA1004636.1 hypothetical protein FVF58_31000 [Paraburkholderia panacisoli]